MATLRALTFTDGGDGDADTLHGPIVDPGGLAVTPSSDATVAEGNKGKTDVDLTATVAITSRSQAEGRRSIGAPSPTPRPRTSTTSKVRALRHRQERDLQTFKVNVLGDVLDESNEDFLVQLTRRAGRW